MRTEPVDEIVIDRQFRLLSLAVQVAPESEETKICPFSTTAASTLPFEEDVTDCQVRELSLATQVTPLFTERV